MSSLRDLGARSEAIVSRNCKARLLPRFCVVTVSVALEYEGGFGVSSSDKFSIGLQSERKEEFEIMSARRNRTFNHKIIWRFRANLFTTRTDDSRLVKTQPH